MLNVYKIRKTWSQHSVAARAEDWPDGRGARPTWVVSTQGGSARAEDWPEGRGARPTWVVSRVISVEFLELYSEFVKGHVTRVT